MKKNQQWPVWAVGLFAATSFQVLGNVAADEGVIELEAFLVEESAQTRQETLQPLSMRVDTAFGDGLTLLEIPRSATVLNEATLNLLGITDYDRLSRMGAGTQRVNYFGLAGSAFLRGARAGTYYDGILRSYQRNEMPMSFGALDALTIVRGPAPAGLSPTLVGGYVNQRPKQPLFTEKTTGWIEVEAGSDGHWRAQLDVGGGLLLWGKPSAWRSSTSINRSGRFHDNVPNDFDSFYGTVKIKLDERTRLRISGEVFQYRSREMAGVNRPTQELIDQGSYVIGESPDLTSPEWGGQVVRPLLEFPYSLGVNPDLWALSIPGDLARSTFEEDLLSRMKWLGDPEVVENLYQPLPSESIPEGFEWVRDPVEEWLNSIRATTSDNYYYTVEFFEAGGEAIVADLDRRAILADPEDRADSENVLLFGEWERRLTGDSFLSIKWLGEYVQTEKVATYGFAMDTEQWIAHLKTEWTQWQESIQHQWRMGLDFRGTGGRMLQDFDAEPFSRRDLTRPEISSNTLVVAGGGTGPDGLNYWSSFNGASQSSKLFQAGAYLSGHWQPQHALELHWGIRGESAWYETGLPREVDRASGDNFADSVFLWSANFNPIWKLNDRLRIYGALQKGKALSPADGGTIAGDTSFTDVQLMEAGVKSSWLKDRLFVQVAVYEWEQSTYSIRDAAAQPLEGSGIEFELSFSLNADWSLIGAYTHQEVILQTEQLGFGAIPHDEMDWALNGGILNATSPRSFASNANREFAGFPEETINLTLVGQVFERVELAITANWRSAFWHDMQHGLRIPSEFLIHLSLGWEKGPWRLQASVDNLFDEDYWIGQEPVFSAGTLILRGPGREWRLSVRYKF